MKEKLGVFTLTLGVDLKAEKHAKGKEDFGITR